MKEQWVVMPWMNRELSILWWINQWHILARYERTVQERWDKGEQIDDAFIEAFDTSLIGILPKWVRFVLTYMENIEGAVWKLYFEEVSTSPSGSNPVIQAFLRRWYVEEEFHRKLIAKILRDCGGEVPGRILWSWNSSWVTWVFGKRLFGPVPLVIGFINELMTARGYRRLAVLAGNPALRDILYKIGGEENVHASFYHAMSRLLVGEDDQVRRFGAWMVNRFATGVGVGYRSRRDGYRVLRILFRRSDKQFVGIGEKIASIGLGSVDVMQRIYDNALRRS